MTQDKWFREDTKGTRIFGASRLTCGHHTRLNGPSSLKNVAHYVPLTYCYWSRARERVKAAELLGTRAFSGGCHWRHSTSDRIRRPFAKLAYLGKRPALALCYARRATFPLKKCHRDFPRECTSWCLRFAEARWRMGNGRGERSAVYNARVSRAS